jgi:hypothetical protein
MSTLDWDSLLEDLRGEDVDLALAASEEIAAHVTGADLPRIYELAEDEDYFVRIMAGDILVKAAGITALPTLLALMLRNEAEGFDNEGLDGAVKALILTNPISARTELKALEQKADPAAKKLAQWGLADLPEESTVVTPIVSPSPPATPKTPWYRSCLAWLGAIMGLVLVGFGVWGYVAPLGTQQDCTNGIHAAWLSVEWTSTPVDPTTIKTLHEQSRTYHLRYLYPYTTYLKEDGTFNDTYTHAGAFMQAFREVNRETKVLAWVGIPLANPYRFGIEGWVDLSNKTTRQHISDFAEQLVTENGFDGVHLNIETVWDQDPHFLTLLEEVDSALADDLMLSVAGSHGSPSILEPLKLRWSQSYYREVAARVDQIAVMTYDSRALHPALYRFWMREQVQGIADGIADTNTELLIGVSVSDEATTTHTPTVESLEEGLAGMCAGTEGRVDGVALYAAWEMDEAEWAMWREWVE